ncbi:MAG: acetate--CoA ligase family protein [Dongiaceae bacterium]
MDSEQQRQKRLANLKRMLNPRHVAFVGGQWLVSPIQHCMASGFKGAIWPVNPKYPEIAGLKTYPSVDALPEAPDATFVAVPRELAIEVIGALARRGAAGAVCYAAGFAELGEEGRALQQQLAAAAGELAMIGPVSYGLLNYVDGVTMFASGPGGGRVERGAAFVSQSGNIALTLTINQRSVPFSFVISAGNQAVLKISDYIEGLADDPRVSAIALYIEGLDDIAGFSRAAHKALKNGKPIVALKVGKSELGAQLAMSHTSSLAGNDALYDALFRRLGVIRVHSVTALLETVKLVSVAPPLNGDRLAIFTCSGGDSLMAADHAADIGLSLPQFSAEQFAALRAQLPYFASVSNPLDYNLSLWGDRPALTKCFGIALAGEFDAGMLLLDFPPTDERGQIDCDISVNALIDAARAHGKQPIVCTTLPETFPEATRQRIIALGCPPMQGLEFGLDAFTAGTWQARRKAAIIAGREQIELPAVVPLPGAAGLIEEAEAKRLLQAFGLTVPPSRVVDAATAPEAAAALGFPVVAKVARPVLAHKTEAGAVALNLGGKDAVAAAIAAMSASVARHQPGLKAEQFLIEKQVTGAVAELIIGVKRDEMFGLSLVIGAGGILVEMVRDAANLLLPTDRAAIEGAIRGLRISKLLAGYRGKPAGDIEAVVYAVAAVAAFAEKNRERLVELDVNPLLVLPKGQGAVAVDALIVLAG